jgi:hypothetical protein
LRVYATSFFDGRASADRLQLSTNGGDTWQHVALPDPPGCLERRQQPSGFGIAIRPGSAGEVLVGTNCGLARRADHAAAWERFDPSPGDAPNSIWDVVALPGGRTYACGDDGLLTSRTGARGTWSKLGKPPSTSAGGYCNLAVDPEDPPGVYVAFAFPSFADIVVAGGSVLRGRRRATR